MSEEVIEKEERLMKGRASKEGRCKEEERMGMIKESVGRQKKYERM